MCYRLFFEFDSNLSLGLTHGMTENQGTENYNLKLLLQIDHGISKSDKFSCTTILFNLLKIHLLRDKIFLDMALSKKRTNKDPKVVLYFIGCGHELNEAKKHLTIQIDSNKRWALGHIKKQLETYLGPDDLIENKDNYLTIQYTIKSGANEGKVITKNVLKLIHKCNLCNKSLEESTNNQDY